MFNRQAIGWRPMLIFICLVGMLCGVFFSRAMLSVSMIVFFVAALVHSSFLQQLKTFLQSPVLLCMSFLFFVPFISGLWSNNFAVWMDVMQTKLPLFLMPLAFAGNWQLSSKQWKAIFNLSLALLAGGCCWSLWQYAMDATAIIESYLRAKSIATPFENDHVRFSWMVALGAGASILLLSRLQQKMHRIAIGLLAILFAIYLHILSARTGLFCFYFFIVIYGIYLLLKSKDKKWAWALLLTVALTPLLAWFALPTFQNRIRYIIYDLSFVQQQTYLPGGNDGNRVLSIKAGWNILSQNFFGVGAGDVRDASNGWYDKNVPTMLPADKLLPSSEWLVYGSAAGWLGVLLFTIAMLLPLFIKVPRHCFIWIVVNSMAALSFLFDIGLEVQFGVFLYTFTVLCCYKWLNAETSIVVK